MGEPLKIGVIGVGNISDQYFAAFPRLPGLELVAVADLDSDRATLVATSHNVAALSVDQLLLSDQIDAVLNLTIPAAHVEIDKKALDAGKHVYGEKPLSLALDGGREVMSLATQNGFRVGSAPDTVLGTGIQTARQILDSGAIGNTVAASAFWSAPGHERWHPAPFFYYQPGGGPMLDMGPYYLTSLVTLLGPVASISGFTSRSTRTRLVETGPHAGTAIPVNVDTHYSALLTHRSGVVSTVTMSFEILATRSPLFEIYGTEGTIAVPDPNRFSDDVELFTSADPHWRVAPVSAGYADAGRGYGLADMARAIETDRPHRASGELALHVLEIMDAIANSGAHNRFIQIDSTVSRPEPVPFGATPDTW